MLSDSMKRRSFLKSASAATAATILTHAASARGYTANEQVSVAAIGTGGRCRRLLSAMRDVPGATVVGVCDVWDYHLGEAVKIVGEKAFTGKDHRAVLERKDVDAVIIGTPDHWHSRMAIAACEAKKDIYLEKPATHEASEGPGLIAAVRKHERVLQVGTQQRSIVHLQKACELIREGHIGRVCKVHMRWNRNYTRMTTEDPVVDESTVDWKTWLGPAKGRPFNAFVFRNWRWFWDFGGGTFIDLMSHWMDMTCWFLGLNLPQTVAALGDRFLYKDKWETPDQSIAIMQFPSQEVDVCFESSFRNHRFDASVEFMGSDATMYVDRGRYEIYPERGSKVKASEMQVGTGTRGSSDYREINGQVNHLTNWIECVRSRKDPAASVESAVLAAQICHMANQALREKRVVTRA